MNLHNKEQFLEVYRPMLEASVKANPQNYAYGVNRVKEISECVIEALAKNNILTLTPIIKNAARSLGIKPTEKAIAEYLNANY